jgi:hypothetical protein
MPISMDNLSAIMRGHKNSKPTSARLCPYRIDKKLGYVGNMMSTTSAWVASMIIVHSSEDVEFDLVYQDDLDKLEREYDLLKEPAPANATAADDLARTKKIRELEKDIKVTSHRLLIATNLRTRLAFTSYVDLTGCHQVRVLTTSNVTQYAKMVGLDDMDDKLRDYIDYWAKTNPEMCKSRIFAERAGVNEWTSYHSGASGSANLIIRASETAPIPGFFTNEEICYTNESIKDPTSMEKARAIPKVTLVKAHAILDVLGGLPEKSWYMGQKAMQAYPIKMYKTLTAAIRILITKQSDIAAGNDKDSIETIMANVQTLVDAMNANISTARADASDDDDDDDTSIPDPGLGPSGGGGGGGGGGGAGGGGGGDTGGGGTGGDVSYPPNIASIFMTSRPKVTTSPATGQSKTGGGATGEEDENEEGEVTAETGDGSDVDVVDTVRTEAETKAEEDRIEAARLRKVRADKIKAKKDKDAKKRLKDAKDSDRKREEDLKAKRKADKDEKDKEEATKRQRTTRALRSDKAAGDDKSGGNSAGDDDAGASADVTMGDAGDDGGRG